MNADEKNLSVNAFPKEVSPNLNLNFIFLFFSFFLFSILWQ